VSRIGAERGQSTVEWVALVLLVSLAFATVAAVAGVRLPVAGLAEAVASKIACAVWLGDECESEADALAAAYGGEVAGRVAEHAPTIHYEDGMLGLPVDYRECREDACSLGEGTGDVWRTADGERAVAFTHVVDCRPDAIQRTETAGADCSGERAGNLYLQYWLYWPDSQTDPWGERGYHPDDWESFQVRIGADVAARASSHHSYNYGGGIRNWASDTGVITKSGWGPFAREWHVSAGSHAGHVDGESDSGRFTPGRRLRLIPIEAIAMGGRDDEVFEVTPPWLKGVYTDPESKET
jgi:hypothetical protein